LRTDKPIYSNQVTARLTNDLLDRVDILAESIMVSRGALIRHAILNFVREQEIKKAPAPKTVTT